MNCTDANTLMMQIDVHVRNARRFSASYNDPQLDGVLAQFLTVYISGIYEEIIEKILREYQSRYCSDIKLNNFMSSHIRRHFMNPSPSKIEELLGSLDSGWGNHMSNFDTTKRASLKSIIDNKNHIAHGEPCSVTLSDIISQYQLSRDYITEIDSLLL